MKDWMRFVVKAKRVYYITRSGKTDRTISCRLPKGGKGNERTLEDEPDRFVISGYMMKKVG